ncbi:MAG: tetratricopeptide repeat protein [Deltaproteobacteria bacterium]
MREEHTDIVEIDAIAVEEWDREQHTPVQVEANLAALVKKSGLDEAWDAPPAAKDEATAPRTTTNTLRRTGSAPALPSKVHKTMAMPTVAAVPPAAPAKASTQPAAAARPAVVPAKPAQAAQPAALAQPKAKLEVKTAPTKPATKTTATRRALAKPAAAPTFSPFGNDAAPAKVETMKSAPVATPVAVTTTVPKRDATPAKVETMKSAPVATPVAAATTVPKRDATPAKVETMKSAPVATPPAATKPVASAPRAPSALELPTWPPAPSATPRAITSEATPRLDVASIAANAQQAAQYDDWDELGGATSVGNRERPQPARKPGEDSVIVDLNAVSKTEHQPSRRPQTYPILTSEQGTTTSGAFVMPTGADPIAAQPAAPQLSHRSEKPTSPAMPAQAAASSAIAGLPPASVANGSGSSTAWHTPLPLAAPPPEPAPQWPSAAGLEYNGAHGSAPEIPLPVTRQDPTDQRLARRTLLATVFPTPTSRKRGLLVAAGALVMILVIVLVSTGGGSSKSTDTTTAKASRATPTTSSTASTASTASATSATSHAATPSHPAAAAVATVDTAAASPPTSTRPAAKKPVVAKRRISRGKKPVVVDYDKKPDPTPEQDEALARARADYATGNHHLFAGETDAAIVAYRQALEAYPNYVAGYRGLGLAYAQQGNRASALLAFKTYVKLAPTAKDVALINKRIANLSVR